MLRILAALAYRDFRTTESAFLNTNFDGILTFQQSMPQLEWDETDFLDCFEVEPDAEDYGVSHTYNINRDAIRLLVTVWQHESVVQISLFLANNDEPITTFACFVRGPIRYVNDKRGRYMQLMNCIVGPNRFWRQEAGDVFDREMFSHGVDVHVCTTPDIGVHVVPRQQP